MVETLPIFPLGIVLYPREQTLLHIFEERYKAMIRYCLDHHAVFGLVLVYEGKISDYGCSAKVVDILKRYEDGRLDIKVEGVQRLHIEKVLRTDSYWQAEVSGIPETEQVIDRSLKERLIAQHIKWTSITHERIPNNFYDEVPLLSYAVAEKIPLRIEQKQILLQIPSENERLSYLVKYFEEALPQLQVMADTKRLVQSDGHFEHTPPTLGFNTDED